MHIKHIAHFSIILTIILVMVACSDSSTGVTDEPQSDIEIKTIENLDAIGDDGSFTFISLKTGEVLAASDSSTTNWDLAFRGTTILTNSGVSGPGEGGAVMLDVPFDNVSIAPQDGYAIDTEQLLAIPTGSGNGWYNYTGEGNPPMAILPIDDLTIIVKTGDGNHYAKVEFISYYEGNPDTSTDNFANIQTRPSARYYTFRYAIQLTERLRELD